VEGNVRRAARRLAPRALLSAEAHFSTKGCFASSRIFSKHRSPARPRLPWGGHNVITVITT
jgi:hypothetical protein